MGNLGTTELILIGVVGIVVVGGILTVLPFWFIFRKAGHNPALSVLMLIPIVDTVLKFYLAFSEWPSLKTTDESGRTSSTPAAAPDAASGTPAS